jgi:UDP-glucose 4-epimerase
MKKQLQLKDKYKGKNILITGGMGFVGSNLAIKLVELGANVLIADAMIEEYGGNLSNIEPVKDKVKINYCDIRDPNSMNYLVRNQDYIFMCAAQVSHLKSMSDPFPDIDININGTAVIMEALRNYSKETVVVKLGSRGQYGSVLKLPATEDLKPEPRGMYEISLLASEYIIQSYYRIHGIKSVLLRLTNIYGPRAQMKHNRYGVANWFVRLGIDGAVIPIYGDGSIKRDFLYIDDCVEVVLLAACQQNAYGEVFNVGHDKPSSFLELAKTIIKVVGKGKWELTPFSDERKAQEPGDFYSDIAKIKDLTGWYPSTSLQEGVAKTVDFYKKNKDKYW